MSSSYSATTVLCSNGKLKGLFWVLENSAYRPSHFFHKSWYTVSREGCPGIQPRFHEAYALDTISKHHSLFNHSTTSNRSPICFVHQFGCLGLTLWSEQSFDMVWHYQNLADPVKGCLTTKIWKSAPKLQCIVQFVSPSFKEHRLHRGVTRSVQSCFTFTKSWTVLVGQNPFTDILSMVNTIFKKAKGIYRMLGCPPHYGVGNPTYDTLCFFEDCICMAISSPTT